MSVHLTQIHFIDQLKYIIPKLYLSGHFSKYAYAKHGITEGLMWLDVDVKRKCAESGGEPR